MGLPLLEDFVGHTTIVLSTRHLDFLKKQENNSRGVILTKDTETGVQVVDTRLLSRGRGLFALEDLARMNALALPTDYGYMPFTTETEDVSQDALRLAVADWNNSFYKLRGYAQTGQDPQFFGIVLDGEHFARYRFFPTLLDAPDAAGIANANQNP